jgi:hypothetical protein
VAKITLWCPDCPDLKLGPGNPGDPNVIVFSGGYADIDDSDPNFGMKMSWVNSFGCPPVRVLETDEVRQDDPTAVKCPACGAAFGSERQVNGHILGAHRNRA